MYKQLFLLALLVVAVSSVYSSERGEKVYYQVCSTCHDQGAFGAPKLGDVAEWRNRIASGKSLLNIRAIEGYAGIKGFMPPKGGDPSLSDQDVRDAVKYMVDRSW